MLQTYIIKQIKRAFGTFKNKFLLIYIHNFLVNVRTSMTACMLI